MPKTPYHIARQEHLGDMLNRLQSLGELAWEWGYENRRAIFWVTESGQRRQKLNTRQAEDFVVELCNQRNIVWLPVPHPGGEQQLAETLLNIERLEQTKIDEEA
jgi:hypothetical protein